MSQLTLSDSGCIASGNFAGSLLVLILVCSLDLICILGDLVRTIVHVQYYYVQPSTAHLSIAVGNLLHRSVAAHLCEVKN